MARPKVEHKSSTSRTRACGLRTRTSEVIRLGVWDVIIFVAGRLRVRLCVKRLAELELRPLLGCSHTAAIAITVATAAGGAIAITVSRTVVHVVSLDRLISVQPLGLVRAMGLRDIGSDRPVTAVPPAVCVTPVRGRGVKCGADYAARRAYKYERFPVGRPVHLDKAALAMPAATAAGAGACEADPHILHVEQGVVGLYKYIAEDPIRRPRAHLKLDDALAPSTARHIVRCEQRQHVIRCQGKQELRKIVFGGIVASYTLAVEPLRDQLDQGIVRVLRYRYPTRARVDNGVARGLAEVVFDLRA
mmetsp:Transcript_11770/g.27269  ORF Transcript_11770/g.27269 Transcript_11770/m.27269 type:complete len:304 (-) Transcript_11770:700-1611(-)